MKGLLFATSLAIQGATVIDGAGNPPRANALVVISAGRIVSVGDATAEALRALPAGTRVIRAAGKWIVPGLIDAHVHAETNESGRAKYTCSKMQGVGCGNANRCD